MVKNARLRHRTPHVYDAVAQTSWYIFACDTNPWWQLGGREASLSVRQPITITEMLGRECNGSTEQAIVNLLGWRHGEMLEREGPDVLEPQLCCSGCYVLRTSTLIDQHACSCCWPCTAGSAIC